MSTKKLKNYSGLYGELDADASPFYVYSELIEDRSGLFNWTIEPHLHAHLYQFFIVQAGKRTTCGRQASLSYHPGRCMDFVTSQRLREES